MCQVLQAMMKDEQMDSSPVIIGNQSQQHGPKQYLMKQDQKDVLQGLSRFQVRFPEVRNHQLQVDSS